MNDELPAGILLFAYLLAFVVVITMLYQIFRGGVIYLRLLIRSITNTGADLLETAVYKTTRRRFTPYLERSSKKLTTEEETWLREHLSYYHRLNDRKKKVFQNRIIDFRDNHTIQGWRSFEVTDEMILLVSALAVQLTFGFRKYYLTAFKRIFVVPTNYYNKFTKQYHKGETHPMGVVVLSWDNLIHGIEVPDDNLNLGLHEFAHALVIQRLKAPGYTDPLFKIWYDKLTRNLEEPRLFELLSSNNYFRKYARTNRMEFFACATEAFFETPNEFKKALPKLYGYMCNMYNQDPSLL